MTLLPLAYKKSSVKLPFDLTIRLSRAGSQSTDGRTALHWACICQFEDILNVLINDARSKIIQLIIAKDILNESSLYLIRCKGNFRRQCQEFWLYAEQMTRDNNLNDGVTTIKLAHFNL